MNEDILYIILIPEASLFQKCNFLNHRGSSREFTSYAAQPNQPRLGQIGLNRLCCLAGGFPQATSTILKIIFLKSGRFRDQNGTVEPGVSKLFFKRQKVY